MFLSTVFPSMLLCPNYGSQAESSPSRAPLHESLCLIHFRCQIWTSATIWMVKEHELSMLLADEFLCETAFSEKNTPIS
jgi:hypothetical protein